MSQKKKRILADFKILTDGPRLRTNAWAGFFGLSMAAMVGAYAFAPVSTIHHEVAEERTQSLSVPDPFAPTMASAPFQHEERIRSNDTVGTLFSRLGIDDPAALDFIRTDPLGRMLARQLRPGKPVSAATDDKGRLVSLYFPLNGAQDTHLIIERSGKGFLAHEERPASQREIVLKSAVISTSLFAATDQAGIPDAIAIQLAEIFSGDIDFHRDLRKGDSFSVTYEAARVRGQMTRSGRILDAEFVNGGKAYRAIYFAQADGTGGYYDTSGKSLRKAFLRSPLEFSRVTSGFSSARFHPVLKEWRAHRGVDYGAPSGTKVRATGDGIVDTVGRQGGYGNLVILRHAGGFSTAYGHLSAFGTGLKRGTRVRQGDVIGFVGQTGLASGPHLHYEFRIRDQQVNPLAATLPEAPPLDERHMASFTPIADEAANRIRLARSATSLSIE